MQYLFYTLVILLYCIPCFSVVAIAMEYSSKHPEQEDSICVITYCICLIPIINLVMSIIYLRRLLVESKKNYIQNKLFS